MEYDNWYLWDEFDAFFVGGTTEWKLSAEAAALTRTAVDMGKWVHMGRVNGGKRYEYADVIGCHSVDGTHLTKGPDRNLPDPLAWRRKSQSQLVLEGSI